MSQTSEDMSGILTKAEEDALLADEDVQRLMSAVQQDDHLNIVPDYQINQQDLTMIPLQPHPLSSLSILCTEDYAGPHMFEVCIIPNASKNPWEYSVSLNKIFIDIQSTFPVDFSIKNRPVDSDLFIRVTPYFLLSQHSQDAVNRCINHEHYRDPSNQNVGDDVRQHIIRCENRNAYYLGKKDDINERLNIVIPLANPQIGTDNVREFFRFACKTSCPWPGMNRRPIQILFTLENDRAEVVGRRILQVRVCSCPKRDKDKEEKELDGGNNGHGTAAVPRGKKRKMNKTDKQVALASSNGGDGGGHNDTNEYALNVKLVGKENFKAALEFCRDRMAGKALTCGNCTGDDCVFRKSANQVTTLLNKQE